jgi:hypothetical protein
MALLSGPPWLDIVGEAWKIGRGLLQGPSNNGMYEVLEYESTLELKDPDQATCYWERIQPQQRDIDQAKPDFGGDHA